VPRRIVCHSRPSIPFGQRLVRVINEGQTIQDRVILRLISQGGYDWFLVDNANRLYPWPEYCGVPGGIPARMTIYTTLGLGGQSPTYAQSVTATQIQNAIAACPANQVVYLYPGTYNIGNWSWGSKSGVTLRGAGPGKTNLRPTGSGSLIGSNYLTMDGTGQAIASGYTKGSMSITLSSTPNAGFVAGRLFVISETTPYANKWGTNIGVFMGTEASGMNWWNANSENKKFSYVSRIVSVVGNTINFASPIPVSFSASQSPRAHWPSGLCVSLCGVENMTLDGSATGSSFAAVRYDNADRCWFKDVEIKNFSGGDNGIIACYTGFQNEFRRVYMHDCQGFPNQSDGQGIALTYADSNSMIVDCIANRVASLFQGAGDNVSCLLYNYCGAMGRASITSSGWLNPAISHHCPEPTMGLHEGNVISSWMHDGYHGSGAWQMIFRNHINGLTPGYSTPYERRMLTLCRGSYYINVIGNVLGDASWTMARYDATNISGEDCAYGLGYPNASGVSLTPGVSWPEYSGSYPDANVLATLLRNANYDYYNHAVVYASGLGHDVPASLFYSSKPSWFGSLAWPAIGPDVSGYVTDIPAQRRWKNYQSSGNLDDLFTDMN
jgi:hypothetical protein